MSDATPWEQKYRELPCGCTVVRKCTAHPEHDTLLAQVKALGDENAKLRQACEAALREMAPDGAWKLYVTSPTVQLLKSALAGEPK